MKDDPSLDLALGRLLPPKLGYQPVRWPETLYIHLRERASATGQSESEYLEFTIQCGEPARLAMLIDAATIGHTAAYRHPEQFAHLRSVLAVMAKKRLGPVRIWCAGCSTGEEAYSAAHSARAAGVNATVLATDVNPVAIAVARSGLLPRRRPMGAVLPNVPPDWSERVPDALRKLVRFEVASLTAPRPTLDAAPFDIIFCRNVLIYFEREQVPRLLERVAAELIPDGYLVISPAEGVLPLPSGLRRCPTPGWLQLVREEKPPVSAQSASPRLPAKSLLPIAEMLRRRAAGAASAPRHVASRPPASPAHILPLEEAARLLSAERAEEAEQILSELLNSDPDHLAGWFLLGEALLARGERAQARAAFLRVTRCSTGATPDVDEDALRRAAIRQADTLCDPPAGRP